MPLFENKIKNKLTFHDYEALLILWPLLFSLDNNNDIENEDSITTWKWLVV